MTVWSGCPSPHDRSGGPSERIEFLRAFLIFGLVALHYGSFPSSDLSPFRGYLESAYPVATFVNSFVLFFFFCAVPLLSAVSGWLFFRGWDGTFGFYRRRYVRRARTILVPMILWNAITLILFIGLAVAAPDSRLLEITNYDIGKLGPISAVNALIGVTQHPINFQFWFLRDLVLTIAISPILGILLRRAPLAGGAALFLAWFLDFGFGIFFRPDVLFFFYLGGLLRLREFDVDRLAPRACAALMLGFITLVGVRTVGPSYIAESSREGAVLYEYGTRLMRLVGVPAIWLSSAYLLRTGWGRVLARHGSLAFFVFAIHWPLNQFVKQLIASLLPWRNDGGMLANYLLTTAITIGLAILIARVLASVMPSFGRLLGGGRAFSDASPSTGVIGPAGARSPAR